MPITQHLDDATLRLGSVGSLIVNCYRATPTVASLDALEKVEDELLAKYPSVATVTIAGPNSSLLRIDEKVRNRSVEMAKKYQGKVRGAAIVIATRGLSAVMARSFMTAYLLVSKQSWPIHTFPSIDTASRWLDKLPGNDTPVIADELVAFERGN